MFLKWYIKYILFISSSSHLQRKGTIWDLRVPGSESLHIWHIRNQAKVGKSKLKQIKDIRRVKLRWARGLLNVSGFEPRSDLTIFINTSHLALDQLAPLWCLLSLRTGPRRPAEKGNKGCHFKKVWYFWQNLFVAALSWSVLIRLNKMVVWGLYFQTSLKTVNYHCLRPNIS